MSLHALWGRTRTFVFDLPRLRWITFSTTENQVFFFPFVSCNCCFFLPGSSLPWPEKDSCPLERDDVAKTEGGKVENEAQFVYGSNHCIKWKPIVGTFHSKRLILFCMLLHGWLCCLTEWKHTLCMVLSPVSSQDSRDTHWGSTGKSGL